MKLADPEYRAKHLERVRLNNVRVRAEVREMIAAFRYFGCVLCGESAECCLSAHHVDPSQKDFALGEVNKRKLSPERVRAELQKCVCLCENCHRKVHAGLLSVP